MAGWSLRSFIDIVEGKKQRVIEPWTISKSSIFADTLVETRRIFPDIQDKLARFIDTKLPNPLMAKYGKHDGPMTGPLAGFYHCHLRDDAILIYKLVKQSILLICVVSHSAIEGRRQQKTVKTLNKFL